MPAIGVVPSLFFRTYCTGFPDFVSLRPSTRFLLHSSAIYLDGFPELFRKAHHAPDRS
jgi:hypothetical protein